MPNHFLRFISYFQCVCVCVGVSIHSSACRGQKREWDGCPESRVTGSGEPPYMGRELDQGPLQEQQGRHPSSPGMVFRAMVDKNIMSWQLICSGSMNRIAKNMVLSSKASVQITDDELPPAHPTCECNQQLCK